MEANLYTVLRPLEIPHCAEGEHMATDPCPDCDKMTGLVPAGPGLFKLCPTCNGTRQGGPEVGPTSCEHPAGTYQPGQTVHLTDEQAQALLDAGDIAPPGARVVYEMRLESSL